MKTPVAVVLLSWALAPASLRAAELVVKPDAKTVALAPLKIGQTAPDFRIKDRNGKEILLAELSAQGPVLVRLTCGCLGCDQELPYFQALHEAYKGQGLVSLAVFKEADAKVKEKKIDMLYAVDSQGASWDVWRTKTMPSNFLIAKGGKIAAMSIGCDPSGLTATRLSEKAANLTGSAVVDVKSKVEGAPAPQRSPQ
jgi:peroxiredoxin